MVACSYWLRAVTGVLKVIIIIIIIGSTNFCRTFCHSRVIALCFSGNANAGSAEKLGGDILVTVTADDKHSVHVWRWMIPDNK